MFFMVLYIFINYNHAPIRNVDETISGEDMASKEDDVSVEKLSKRLLQTVKLHFADGLTD